MTLKAILCTLAVAALGAVSRPAAAAVYDLRAASTTITMDDGTQVPMWGFGRVGDPSVSIPGPALAVPPGDDTLIINLTNELSVPVSIVIPGIPAPLTPVWNDGTSGPRTNLAQRAVSFTYVAEPGQTVAYQWNNVQPGTYLYQSGTHPAVQVPMGLYGAVRHDEAPGQTYGVAHDLDLLLVYSEVDPVLNGAVADLSYGTASYPSTIDYQPRYFLVNGQESSTPIELQQSVNQRALVRVVNAGLRSIVPTLARGSMRLLAEDGQPAPYALNRYSMLLSPGMTRDALLVLTEPGSTVLFDRRGASKLARITAALDPGSPVAAADSYNATEDTTLDTALASLDGVLVNDTGVGLSAELDTSTIAGTLSLQPDGTFTYAPALNFHGVDSFTYHATDGPLVSNVVTVTINVASVNDAPTAVDDAYQVAAGTTLDIAAPGLLANDSDVDLDTLIAQVIDLPTLGALVSAPNGSFQYTPDPGTTLDSFTYQASDGVEQSGLATVTLTVVVLTPVNAPPIAADDNASTLRNVATIIDVIANDSDPEGAIDPNSVVAVSPTTRGGTVVSQGDGTVLYTPRNNFKGTDTFSYVVSDVPGAVSNSATVHVNVVKP